jgi:hypothetical protein
VLGLEELPELQRLCLTLGHGHQSRGLDHGE